MVFGFIKRVFSSSKPKNQMTSNRRDSGIEHELPQAPANKPVIDESQSDCDYLSLATSFNDFLLGDQQSPNTQPANELEIFIINSLETMLDGDIPDSAVPRLPEVAMALLKQLSDVNITPETIMSYINRDPALASEVLNMSNSAMFRANGQDKIVNLEKALVLLGLNNLKTIVSSALMKRLLVIAPIYFRMFGQHLWQHSLDCGQACRALANYYGQCDQNNAYLVGLMHDIGKLAIFGLLTKALGQHLDYKPRGAVFSGIVRDHSQALSVRIAESWGLPDYLIIALSEQIGSHSLGDCSIYGFILNQANILAEFKAVAEKAVKTGQSFEVLLELYSIPLHLFMEAFPAEYDALAKADAKENSYA